MDLLTGLAVLLTLVNCSGCPINCYVYCYKIQLDSLLLLHAATVASGTCIATYAATIATVVLQDCT